MFLIFKAPIFVIMAQDQNSMPLNMKSGEYLFGLLSALGV